MFSYPMVVYDDMEDGARVWRGNFPGLHGCWLEAGTEEEVLRVAPSVLAEYAASCSSAGWTPPPPPSVDELRESGIGYVVVVEAE